ncbi:hypothetical protein NBRC116584_10900 [Hydrogenophaga sp. 5NK40-0174]
MEHDEHRALSFDVDIGAPDGADFRMDDVGIHIGHSGTQAFSAAVSHPTAAWQMNLPPYKALASF